MDFGLAGRRRSRLRYSHGFRREHRRGDKIAVVAVVIKRRAFTLTGASWNLWHVPIIPKYRMSRGKWPYFLVAAFCFSHSANAFNSGSRSISSPSQISALASAAPMCE